MTEQVDLAQQLHQLVVNFLVTYSFRLLGAGLAVYQALAENDITNPFVQRQVSLTRVAQIAPG